MTRKHRHAGRSIEREPADRGARRRLAIYAALWAELSEKGHAGLTVAGVARRAGASRGSFYHHFTSVDDALERAYRLHTDNSIRSVEAGVAAGKCTEDAIIGDITALIRSVSPERVLNVVELQLMASRNPRIRKVLLDDYRLKTTVAARMLRIAIRRGELRRGIDVRWEAHRIYTACFGIYLWYFASGDRSDLAALVERQLRSQFVSLRRT